EWWGLRSLLSAAFQVVGGRPRGYESEGSDYERGESRVTAQVGALRKNCARSVPGCRKHPNAPGARVFRSTKTGRARGSTGLFPDRRIRSAMPVSFRDRKSVV